MARFVRRGIAPAKMLKLFLLIVAATGVAWLAVATYLPRAYPQLRSPDDPDLVFRETGKQLLATRGRLDDAAYERLAAAMRRQPLASEPFLFFGMRALGAEDLEGAERLLVEACNRDPRSEMARLALMGLYLRTGRVREGSAEVAALVRVMPRAGELLVPELARLAATPASREAVVEAVGDEPVMADVLGLLVQNDVDPDVVLSLARRQPRREDGSFAPWQQSLLAKLVEQDEVRRAHGLWRRFVGAQGNELLYDADFRGLPGPPPFNWELTASDVGAAEQARGGGGLEIEYFGRKSGPLARQLLLLRPGRYRLEFQVEGSANGQGSQIVLQLTCRDGTSLLDMPFRGLTYTPRGVGADINVPAGCSSQWLSFAGRAGEFPNSQRARVSGLVLRPAGGS